MNSQAEESNPEAKTHALVRYDAMCRAIDAAYAVDEVKAIHDQAATGQKARPPKGNQYTGKVVRSSDPTEPKTLEQLGISKQEMSEWRKLNSISDEQFEEGLATRTLPDLLTKPSPVTSDALGLYGMMHEFERRALRHCGIT